MHRFRTGLVVGKFAPLHKGHVHLIETAREQCDHLLILCYSRPAYPEASAERQEGWLATLFPGSTALVATDAKLAGCFPGSNPLLRLPPNDAGADVHRDFVFLLLEQVFRQTVDAVFTSESYGDGFAAHLSRRQQERNPSAPAVTHVLVDPARLQVPVSGSDLRFDLWERWQFLPPPVARSLVRRVVFLGGESSGKSTLAVAMATELETASVPEYGRELWAAKGGTLEFDDYVRIAEEQAGREERALAESRRWLFCDTSPLTTLFYCLDQFGRAARALAAAAERPYDHVVLCAPDFPFSQDGTRRDDGFRVRQHGWYTESLAQRGIPYHLAAGSLATRVESLRDYLRSGRDARPLP